MRATMLACVLSVSVWIHPATAQNIFYPEYPIFDQGTVSCRPVYDASSVCRRLSKAFAYIRSDRGFEAAPGLITDGASIPKWARKIIGEPFDEAFIRAAVLHDHYSRRDNAVLSYLTTQRLFYWALIDSKVPNRKALAMYAAVIVGAPKWTLFYKSKPEKCDTPMDVDCVRNDGSVKADDVLDYAPSVFDAPGVEDAIETIGRSPAVESEDIDAVEREALGARVLLGLPVPPPAGFGDE